MTVEIDEDRIKTDPRYRAWALARRGAMRTLGKAAGPMPPRRIRPPFRRRTNLEILLDAFRRHDVLPPAEFIGRSLTAIRTMAYLGDPQPAIVDKIDDLLFKLKGIK